MTRYKSCSILAFSILVTTWTSLNSVGAFTLKPTIIHYSSRYLTGTILSSSNADDGYEQRRQAEATTDESEKSEFNWLEEWALEGKDAVALMKTQERTQRVMLAQMTEDRIYEITKVLDTLVDQATGEIAEANMPKAEELAMQTSLVIKNLSKHLKIECMVSTGGTLVREDFYRLT